MKTRKIKINIKTINDLTIKEYRDILHINETEQDGWNKNLKIIGLLTDLSEEELRGYDHESVAGLLGVCNEILSRQPEPVKSMKPFKLNGRRYGFDLNLDKMATGQFVDLDNFSKEPIKNLHILSAILWRPVKGLFNKTITEYDSGDVMDRSKLFEDRLTMDKAVTAAFFLLNLKRVSIEDTQVSLELMRSILEKRRNRLKKGGN